MLLVSSCKRKDSSEVNQDTSVADTTRTIISNELDTINVIKPINKDDQSTQPAVEEILKQRDLVVAESKNIQPVKIKDGKFELNIFKNKDEVSKIIKVEPIKDTKNYYTFYYKNNKLYYATLATLDSPSESFYFEDDKMIRWNGIQGKSISNTLPEYAAKTAEILEESKRLNKLAVK